MATAGPPAFWAMPDRVEVRLVGNATDLANAEAALAAADACGIDAEWRPGAAQPAAALLQLALRSSASGACTALLLV